MREESFQQSEWYIQTPEARVCQGTENRNNQEASVAEMRGWASQGVGIQSQIIQGL